MDVGGGGAAVRGDPVRGPSVESHVWHHRSYLLLRKHRQVGSTRARSSTLALYRDVDAMQYFWSSKALLYNLPLKSR